MYRIFKSDDVPHTSLAADKELNSFIYGLDAFLRRRKQDLLTFKNSPFLANPVFWEKITMN